MSIHTSHLARVLFLLVAAFLCTGCTVYERSYPGRSTDQVWSAMVAVAEQPDYDSEKWGKWHVMENEVLVDEQYGRIEIYRELRRVVYNAGMVRPDEQDREFRITVSLRESGMPRIRFETRALELPVDGYTESQRYFDDVGALLETAPGVGAPPATPPTVAQPAKAPEAPAQPTQAPVSPNRPRD